MEVSLIMALSLKTLKTILAVKYNHTQISQHAHNSTFKDWYNSIFTSATWKSTCAELTFTITSDTITGNALLSYRKIPRGLHFSKALLEGLIFRGAYIRRGLSKEGNLRFQNRLG